MKSEIMDFMDNATFIADQKYIIIAVRIFLMLINEIVIVYKIKLIKIFNIITNVNHFSFVLS